MVCSKCGANQPDGVQFCTVCGNSMDAKPAAPAVQTNYYAPMARSGGVSVVGIIFMIVGAIYGISYLAYYVYNLITYGAGVTDVWVIINTLLGNLCIALALVGVGVVLNKLTKR